jgi:hypothetical protein
MKFLGPKNFACDDYRRYNPYHKVHESHFIDSETSGILHPAFFNEVDRNSTSFAKLSSTACQQNFNNHIHYDSRRYCNTTGIEELFVYKLLFDSKQHSNVPRIEELLITSFFLIPESTAMPLAIEKLEFISFSFIPESTAMLLDLQNCLFARFHFILKAQSAG